jgi:hypothetical protein
MTAVSGAAVERDNEAEATFASNVGRPLTSGDPLLLFSHGSGFVHRRLRDCAGPAQFVTAGDGS